MPQTIIKGYNDIYIPLWLEKCCTTGVDEVANIYQTKIFLQWCQIVREIVQHSV